jgi:DNA topoisomerase I
MKSQTFRQEATSLPLRTSKRKKPVYAESSSEDDTPLASSPMKSNQKSMDAQDDEPDKHPVPNGKPPRKKIKNEADDDDDDKPIMSSAGRKRRARTKSEPDSVGGVPLQKTPRRKKVKEEESNSSEPEVPKKKKRMNKGKTEETEDKSPTKAKGKKKKDEEEEEEEVFKWWENEADPNGDDGTVKWQTLEHSGVIFPPPYEPLPDNVKMKYKGIFLLEPSCLLLFTDLQENRLTFRMKQRKLLVSMLLC